MSIVETLVRQMEELVLLKNGTMKGGYYSISSGPISINNSLETTLNNGNCTNKKCISAGIHNTGSCTNSVECGGGG